MTPEEQAREIVNKSYNDFPQSGVRIFNHDLLVENIAAALAASEQEREALRGELTQIKTLVGLTGVTDIGDVHDEVQAKLQASEQAAEAGHSLYLKACALGKEWMERAEASEQALERASRGAG